MLVIVRMMVYTYFLRELSTRNSFHSHFLTYECGKFGKKGEEKRETSYIDKNKVYLNFCIVLIVI